MLSGARFATLLGKYRWILNLGFIGLSAYFAATTTNAFVANSLRTLPEDDAASANNRSSRGKANASKPMYSTIAERNLFNLKREVVVPQESEDEPEAGSDELNPDDIRDCSLPIQVRGLMVADGVPEWSVALIYDNTERTSLTYSINEGRNEVRPGAFLTEIRDEEVLIRVGDHLEKCTMEDNKKAPRAPVGRPSAVASKGQKDDGDKESGIAKVSETEYTIEQEEINDVMGNLSKVATQARIVPSFKNGKPNGFKLFSIKPGSLYTKIGLRNGDVVQRINGYDMDSPDKALEVYQKLQDSKSITVEIQRRGKPMTMSYSIQ